MAKDNLETNPITIKPETASHVTEQFSWVPLPYCSPPGCPFPIKSLALSAHVSPQTIHFCVLDKSPVSGPGGGPPSCNIIISILLDRKMRPRKATCPGQLLVSGRVSHLDQESVLLSTVCAQLLSHVQLFVTPMDCRPPGSSVHGIFQARILE